jgi:glycosyltransferase involved in cell wall biosynthesis
MTGYGYDHSVLLFIILLGSVEMKIAVIGAKGIPPKQGGIEHYCAELYPRIVAKGHTVDLFARSSCTDMPAFESYDYEGVSVVSLPGSGRRGMDAFVTSAIGAMVASRADYDIIHFHALGPALFTCLPKLASSAKIVVTCQGLDWQRAKWGMLSSGTIRLGEQAAVKFADELIVVSEDLRTYFKQTYGRDSTYIPNAPAGYGASDPNFGYGRSLGLEPGKYMIFLGRLVPEKCPDLVLKAFQALKPPGWKMVFIGGNSDTAALMAELTANAAGDGDVLFTGELRGQRLAEMVRGAGLFVLPSNLEGLPLAMLEAMAEGIPVVASDIPPHQQLIGDDRGVLFQAGNVESCVKALDWATQNSSAMQQMAAKAQRNVQLNYSWERITEDNLRLYKDVCAPLPQPVFSQKLLR